MSYVYFLTKAGPAALMLIPILKLPIIGSFTSRILEKALIDVPITIICKGCSVTYNNVSSLFSKKLQSTSSISTAVYQAEDFQEWENIEMITPSRKF